MRIQINFHPKGKLILPHSYQHILQGFFYSLMGREEAKDIHDASSFKFFCYSMIEGRFQLDREKHMISFSGPCRICFSSIDNEMVLRMVFLLGKKEHPMFHGQEIIIDDISFIEAPKVQQEVYRIHTLSPISIHQTVVLPEKKKTLYFSPEDDDFEPLLKKNFLRKYESYYGKSLGEEVLFGIQPANEPRLANIRYKDFTIIGYLGDFYLKCNKEHLGFLFDVGLGDRNSFGFGMFEILS